MNIGFLLFSANGRIGRKGFWLGWLILLVVNLFAAIPLLGILIALLGIYMGVCVWGKRFHDMGKTAWLVLIPMLVPMIVIFVGFGVAVAMGGGAGGDIETALENPASAIVLGAGGVAAGV